MTSSEYGGRLEDEIEEMDDVDEEPLIVDILSVGTVEFEELQEARIDVGPVESSLQLWLLLLSLLFVSGFEMATGPMGNSTSSTRTVPEALCRGEGNSLWRGEAFSSGCSLGAATYAGDRLQQNQLYPFSSPILFFLISWLIWSYASIRFNLSFLPLTVWVWVDGIVCCCQLRRGQSVCGSNSGWLSTGRDFPGELPPY